LCAGLLGLVCPSRTSERGGEGEGHCVKEGRGEDSKGARVYSKKERDWGCNYATTFNTEVHPKHRRFGRRESDFALERLVEYRAFAPERVRLVALR